MRLLRNMQEFVKKFRLKVVCIGKGNPSCQPGNHIGASHEEDFVSENHSQVV